MNNLKHTKGNWQPKQFKKSFIVNDQDLTKQTIICQMLGNGDEVDANAKLIAAAPDLLEALINLREICLRTTDTLLLYDELLLANKAIKKAISNE